MRISCPPTISPCYYGVDTPTRGQLIAASKTVDEIRDYHRRRFTGVFVSGGTASGCGERPGQPTTYCTSCYTGKYPTDWVEVHDIKPAAKECAVVTTTP